MPAAPAWGLGGLTFGLTMRYLGLSLGMAVALGLTTVIGTLGPPIFQGTLGALAAKPGSVYTFAGIAVVIIGIVIVALAGNAKEKQLANVSGDAHVPDRGEFDLRKGFLIALFSGVMSSFFAFGLAAGRSDPRRLGCRRHRAFVGRPTGAVRGPGRGPDHQSAVVRLADYQEQVGGGVGRPKKRENRGGRFPDVKTPLLANYLLAALGGDAVVFPVLLLHHGRKPDGQVRLFVVDPAHGVDHPVLDPVGLRAEGVAGDGGEDTAAGMDRYPDPGRVDRDHRHRQHAVEVGYPLACSGSSPLNALRARALAMRRIWRFITGGALSSDAAGSSAGVSTGVSIWGLALAAGRDLGPASTSAL
ncbi:MAG: L-rhamnose/proton symporter RhaT [Asticcacaulis sp.]